MCERVLQMFDQNPFAFSEQAASYLIVVGVAEMLLKVWFFEGKLNMVVIMGI
jgi:hypothetical protein